MRKYIDVKKERMPYSLDILLGRELFNLKFQYNQADDLFTVDLSRDNIVICYGEPIIYGVPLFRDVYISGLFPKVDILPFSASGSDDAVTYANFGAGVRLMVDDEET